VHIAPAEFDLQPARKATRDDGPDYGLFARQRLAAIIERVIDGEFHRMQVLAQFCEPTIRTRRPGDSIEGGVGQGTAVGRCEAALAEAQVVVFQAQ
jgi:hypothetical protein